MIYDLRFKIRAKFPFENATERRFVFIKIYQKVNNSLSLSERLIPSNEVKSLASGIFNVGMSEKFLKVIVFFISLAFVLALAPPVLAQTQTGISVTPSIVHIDLSTDAPQYELVYKNNTKYDITLLLSVQDFTELEEGYRLSFLTGQDAKNYKYSLSSWISFENKTLQISPGGQKSVKIFIDALRITKGGHYASIMAEIEEAEAKDKISLKAVLSSLLFVRASTGLEVEQARINDFIPIRDGVSFPDRYILSFNNEGNVHVVPYGLIEVYDPLGRVVAKGILNEGSLDALPESVRRYDINVKTYQKVLIPGFYKARISTHFGKTNKNLSKEISFFSQGSFDFLKIGLGIVVLVILMLYLRRRRNK